MHRVCAKFISKMNCIPVLINLSASVIRFFFTTESAIGYYFVCTSIFTEAFIVVDDDIFDDHGNFFYCSEHVRVVAQCRLSAVSFKTSGIRCVA
jgi:hypothetical protein